MPDSRPYRLQQIATEFRSRVVPRGRVLYREGVCFAKHSPNAKMVRVLSWRSDSRMPDFVIEDAEESLLYICAFVRAYGVITEIRRAELSDLFRDAAGSLVFVTVAESRNDLSTDFPGWDTAAWAATEPDHLIYFGGKRLLGPYPLGIC